VGKCCRFGKVGLAFGGGQGRFREETLATRSTSAAAYGRLSCGARLTLLGADAARLEKIAF
jgi:hypothetical protein